MRSEENTPLLQLDKLRLSYKSRTLVKDVSFSMQAGESIALLGESGAGKSLIATSVLQLLPNEIESEGLIKFSGREISQVITRARGKDIAYIPQDPLAASFPLFTIKKQWEHVCLSQKRSFDHTEASSWLHAAGIANPAGVLNSFPHQLSGGELQRVLIAIALSGTPKLMIADEPTTALDTVNQQATLRLIKSMCHKHQVALLFISHDLSLLQPLCERIVVLKEGTVVEEGKTTEVLSAPRSSYAMSLIAGFQKVQVRAKSLAPMRMAVAPVLEVRDLSVNYSSSRFFWQRRRTTAALKKVNLQLVPGRITGLAGVSGSGKTTLLRSLAGLVPHTEDQIFYQGQPLKKLDRQQRGIYRKNVQVIFQNPASSLNPRMQVKELLQEAIQTAAFETNYQINSLLDWVKLSTGLVNHYPSQLSGGEKQRLCIARALALQPEVLLCDEPTSSLDQSIQADLLDLFLYLKKELNLGILLVSHNLTSIRYTCDDIAIMDEGEIKEIGPVEKVFANPISPSTRQLLKAEPALTHNFLLENPT